MAATAFSTAPSNYLAEINANPLSLKIPCPFSMLVPSNLITTGTPNSNSPEALTIPSR